MKIICLLFLFAGSCLQAQRSFEFDKLRLDENAFYMVSRGTDTKAGYVAKDFNRYDYCVTHVGIGIVLNQELYIYHVSNERQLEQSALIAENLGQFLSNSDVYYVSVWKYMAGRAAIEKLKTILETYSKKEVPFDFAFNETTNDALYCSEFCAKVLTELDPDAFHFPTIEITLNAMYSLALEKKILRYWPVDFYQENPGFTKISEALIQTGKQY